MKKIIFIISALFFFLATAVHAHGPVRAKQTASIYIDAPASEVWDVIKNYDDMSWLPGVKSTKAEGGNKKGATRVLTFTDGSKVTEELKAYKEDKMSYKYKITDMSVVGTIQHSGQEEEIPAIPVNNYQATLTVKPKDDGSELTWVATYYRAYLNNNPPPELNEESADEFISKVLTRGLNNVQQQVKPGYGESEVKIKIKR